MNKLISLASGEYIAVLNSDDYWELDKLEKQYDFMEKNKEYAACFTWVQYINKKGKKIFNIDSFDELLDVRDNLKLPIKYYAAKEHEKCEFYITHDSELYLLNAKLDGVKSRRSNAIAQLLHENELEINASFANDEELLKLERVLNNG